MKLPVLTRLKSILSSYLKNWFAILLGFIFVSVLTLVFSYFVFFQNFFQDLFQQKMTRIQDWSFLDTKPVTVRKTSDPPQRIPVPDIYSKRALRTKIPLLLLKNLPATNYHPVQWRLMLLRGSCHGCIHKNNAKPNVRAQFVPAGMEFEVVDAFSYMGNGGEQVFYLLKDNESNIYEINSHFFKNSLKADTSLILFEQSLLSLVQQIELGKPIETSACAVSDIKKIERLLSDLELFTGLIKSEKYGCLFIYFETTESFLTFHYARAEWGISHLEYLTQR